LLPCAEFGIVPGVRQTRHRTRRSPPFLLCGCGSLLLFALLAGDACGADAEQKFEQPQGFDDPVRNEEMLKSLAEVARAFGPDAVILQTALLNEAVRNGSLLEARVDAPAYTERDGRKYVVFTLESGIVYNDNSVSAEERVRRTWRDIVATAFRRLPELNIKGDGVAVSVGYHHRSYEDERHLRDELPEKRGEAEKVSYFVGLEDAHRLVKGTADADAVLHRTAIVRGGEPVRLE